MRNIYTFLGWTEFIFSLLNEETEIKRYAMIYLMD